MSRVDRAESGGLGFADIYSDFDFEGTAGRDRLNGTNSPDSFDMSQGGDDRVSAGYGDDTVYFGAAFTGADRVNGGKGFDTVTLDGDYSGGIDIQANSLTRIEQLVLEGGSYIINGELNGGDRGSRLLVDAGALTADQSLHLDVVSSGNLFVTGSAGADILHATSTNGEVDLLGESGDDVLTGGAGRCILFGGVGADRIEMGGSENIAVYGPLDSNAKVFDTIVNFAASGGRIEIGFDSDTATDGTQHDFHLGKTADRTGDILFKYDAGKDETIVKVFTDADHTADFVLHLTGDVLLTPADFIFG